MNPATLFLAGLFAGIFGDFFWAYIVNWPKKKGKIPIQIHIFNYHFHHSALGIIFIIAGLLTNFYSLALIGFGFGIIISHTLRTKELVFIQKVKTRR